MKNFAELKRTIKPGMTLKVVQHDYRPELTGTTRVVTDVQGNGYFFRMNGEGNRLWSGYAKAHCYSFLDANTYRQDEGCKCSCGCKVDGAPDTYHSEGCNIRVGKRFAWTIQIVEQRPDVDVTERMQMTDQQLIEYALRITALVNAPEHMTVQAAAAVVEAAMFGRTEGTVRAEQQACIDGKSDPEVLKQILRDAKQEIETWPQWMRSQEPALRERESRQAGAQKAGTE